MSILSRLNLITSAAGLRRSSSARNLSASTDSDKVHRMMDESFKGSMRLRTDVELKVTAPAWLKSKR